MDRSKLFWGIGIGFAAGMVALSRRKTDRVEVRCTLPAPPKAVTELISQVEREPELIPGIQSVTVLERGPDWVRYRVGLAGGAWVRYCKTWDTGRIAWSSEAGTLGIRQTGIMHLSERESNTDVHMTVETAFHALAIGPLAAAGSHPYASYAFRAWMENLGRALSAEN